MNGVESKQTKVEAAQFVDDISCMYMEDDWGLPYCEAVTFLGRKGRYMNTPDGLVKVNPGDWILKFPDNTFRVFSEEKFQKEHEELAISKGCKPSK